MSPPNKKQSIKTSKPPTSFLSLPHELRQQIFLIAVEYSCIPPPNWTNKAVHMLILATRWAANFIKIHRDLRADVDFAAASFKKRLEGLDCTVWVGADGMTV